jgi:hypothetical protein
MTEQHERWTIIRAAVAHRMIKLDIPDQATLRRRSGLSQPTAQLYTTSKEPGGVPRKQQAAMLAKALEWPHDWYDRLGAGEDLTDWPADWATNPPPLFIPNGVAEARNMAAELRQQIDVASELLRELRELHLPDVARAPVKPPVRRKARPRLT